MGAVVGLIDGFAVGALVGLVVGSVVGKLVGLIVGMGTASNHSFDSYSGSRSNVLPQ